MKNLQQYQYHQQELCHTWTWLGLTEKGNKRQKWQIIHEQKINQRYLHVSEIYLNIYYNITKNTETTALSKRFQKD